MVTDNPVLAAAFAVDEGENAEVLKFPHPEEWFIQWLVPHTQRTLGGNYTWCAEWWRHAEAISRITAMWWAWEALRWEGSIGFSEFLKEHLDHHMGILLSKERGPFSGCRPDRHNPPETLPYTPAPPEIWNSSAFSDDEEPPA